MTAITSETIALLLAKLEQNRPDMSFMTDEVTEALDTLVSMAFEQLWPPDDVRHVTERAGAGFAIGFQIGRDYEQGLQLSALFEEGGESEES